MSSLILKGYVGDTLNQDLLSKYFKMNGTGTGVFSTCKEYIAFFYPLSEDSTLNNVLKISSERQDIWFRRNIDLRLYIWLDEHNIIQGIEACKFIEIFTGHGRPIIDEDSLNQDETKIINRLMLHNRKITK